MGDNITAMSLASSVSTTLNALGSRASKALEAKKTPDQVQLFYCFFSSI